VVSRHWVFPPEGWFALNGQLDTKYILPQKSIKIKSKTTQYQDNNAKNNKSLSVHPMIHLSESCQYRAFAKSDVVFCAIYLVVLL